MNMHLLFAAAIALAAAQPAFAQSSDRDHPVPLAVGEVTGSMDNNNEEGFYSFIAGPGELTLTVDVRANPEQQGLLNFELLAGNGATQLICCEFAQADGGGTGRAVKSVRLSKRQTVMLHVTNGPIGGGTFRVRIAGAAVFAAAPRTEVQVADGGGRGNPIAVPANGRLRIEMTDGSAQEFDLRRVRNVAVRQ